MALCCFQKPIQRNRSETSTNLTKLHPSCFVDFPDAALLGYMWALPLNHLTGRNKLNTSGFNLSSPKAKTLTYSPRLSYFTDMYRVQSVVLCLCEQKHAELESSVCKQIQIRRFLLSVNSKSKIILVSREGKKMTKGSTTE